MVRTYVIMLMVFMTFQKSFAQWNTSGSKIYYNSGNVGIGHPDPNYKLEVNGEGAFGTFLDVGLARDPNARNRGLNITDTREANIQIVTHSWSGAHGVLFGAYAAQNRVNANLSAVGNTKHATRNSHSAGAGSIMFTGNGGIMDFLISPVSPGIDENVVWGTPKLRIRRDGKVSIGTTSFAGNHLLYVNGSIIATEVNVKLEDQWPDYVFKPGYELMPLMQLKDFIHHNHHLPDVPSEKEVEKEGVAIGEMKRILLQKVEELTLYIIQQAEKVDAQGKEIELLKSKIK